MSYTAFDNRQTHFHGVEEVSGYQLKVYSVCADGDFDRYRFDGGVAMAVGALPQPAVDAARPGAGFVILHQGATADYVVLSWWDNENELPTHVFVHRDGDWRPSQERESFCVWDLEIMWQERQLYVRTVLGELEGQGLDVYLAAIAPIGKPI